MTSSKIFLSKNKIDLLIIIDLAFLALTLWLTQITDFDLTIQQYFFDFQNKSWLIDESKEPIKTFFFYLFPKIIFCLAISYFLIATLLGFKQKNSANNFFARNRQIFLLILLGLTLIPLIAGNVKKFTNIYCPNQLLIYTGDNPYVRIFDSYPQNFLQGKKGQCFPAGHCITGFAFMILFFALRKRSHRFLALFVSLLLGWILGIYQMAKGAHFLSDTLIAMLLCFLIAALIARVHSARLQKIRN